MDDHDAEHWLREHGRFVRELARTLQAGGGGRHDVEDAAQDAWAAALEARPPANPIGWLVSVARRRVARAARSEVRRRDRERDVARDERVQATDAIAARAEVARLVGAAVHGLAEPYRAAILLRYFDGLPPRVIARRLDVPVATVHSRLRRGIERLRTDLERSADDPRRWRSALALAAGSAGPRTVLETLPRLALMSYSSRAILATVVVLLLSLVTLGGLRLARGSVEPDVASATRTVPSDGRLVNEASADVEVSPDRNIAAFEDDGASDVPNHTPAPGGAAVLVVDAEGNVVEGADVLGGSSPLRMQRVATTAASGRATLAFDPSLRWVGARASGWAPSPLLSVDPEKAMSSPLVLELPMRGASLVVHVTDEGGAPVTGATVRAGRGEDVDYRLASGTMGRTAPWNVGETDGAGRAEFRSMPLGWTRVAVEHEDHAGTSTFATLEREREHSVELTLRRGFRLVGTVRGADGLGVANASVARTSTGRSTRTDELGRYALGPITGGKIEVIGPGGRRLVERLRGAAGETIAWDPVLDSPPTIFGRVLGADGEPVPGACVRACDDTWPGWSREVVTDSGGRFEFFDEDRSRVRLEVVDGGPLPLTWRDDVRPDDCPLDLRLSGDRASAAVGRVVGLEGGALLRLRHVTARDRQRLTGGDGVEVALATDGEFEIGGLSPGQYELVLIGAPVGWHRLATFDVDGTNVARLGDLRVPEPGRVLFRIVRAAAPPEGEARFLLERRDRFVVVLSQRGTLPDELLLAPGRYTLQTELTPGPQREIEFDVASSEDVPVRVVLGRTFEHDVLVRVAGGERPLGPVALRVVGQDDGVVHLDSTFDASTDGEVRATAELPPGRFEITARDASGRSGSVSASLFGARDGGSTVIVLE